MKKGFMLLIALMFMFFPASKAVADWYPAISIDGQMRSFNPPCQIVNQRTMVPLRFVVEDTALHGIVTWDANSGKVSVVCREKDFEFTIGDPRALVNGEVTYLDAAPYVYQNRTYLPLRFLTENMGGTVYWNGSRGEVRIRFDGVVEKTQNEVFAYYYYGGFAELQANAKLFTDVALRWFETDADGDLFYEYQDNYQQVLRYLQDQGIKTHASVVLMDKAALHTLLSNPERRANLINQLSNEVKKNNYDGVNIDFEFIPSGDTNNFTIFLRELRNSLEPGKTLSAAVFARTASDNWATGYDYQAIGDIVDKLVLMTYDYSYKTSSPGPVAPLWWVDKVVDYMTVNAHIPAEKLLLGMATYGYNWGSGSNATTVTWSKLNSIKNSYAVSEHFDNGSMSPYYTYTDGQGIYHQIWLENERSLSEKWNLARENNLGGISFWRIGNGFQDLYNLLQNNQT